MKPSKRDLTGIALGIAIGAGGTTAAGPDEGAIRKAEQDNARVLVCNQFVRGPEKLACLQAVENK